jgi:hypothetical protein
MTAFNVVNSFKEQLAEKAHNLGSDTIKIGLSNTALSAGMTVLANVTPIGASGGYAAKTTAQQSSAQTSGTYKLVLTDTVFTASGAAFGAFRYVFLYNDTSTGDMLIGWYDYGSSITLSNTETFTVNLDDTNGFMTLA